MGHNGVNAMQCNAMDKWKALQRYNPGSWWIISELFAGSQRSAYAVTARPSALTMEGQYFFFSLESIIGEEENWWNQGR